MSASRYVMRMSLNVLNHMGLHLYSNTPAVLAEAIANAWDADAAEVHVEIDSGAKTISVKDNGVGMNLDDVNDKFLYVGHQKRHGSDDSRTPRRQEAYGTEGDRQAVIVFHCQQDFRLHEEGWRDAGSLRYGRG